MNDSYGIEYIPTRTRTAKSSERLIDIIRQQYFNAQRYDITRQQIISICHVILGERCFPENFK